MLKTNRDGQKQGVQQIKGTEGVLFNLFSQDNQLTYNEHDLNWLAR